MRVLAARLVPLGLAVVLAMLGLPASRARAETIGRLEIFVDRVSAGVGSVFIPTGVATDRDGNVFVYDSTSAGADVIRKYTAQRQFVGAAQVQSQFSVSVPGGFLARDPATGLIFMLLATGEMRQLDPVNGLMAPLVDLRTVAIDTTAVYDVATSRTVASAAGLIVPPFTWGDFAILVRGNRIDLFISGRSPITPFIARIRVESSIIVSAKAIVFSRLTTAGNVNLPRGVAVSPAGVVLTTMPVLTQRGAQNLGLEPLTQPIQPSTECALTGTNCFRPAPSPFETCQASDGGACAVVQDSAVAFAADFEPAPFADPQAALNAIVTCPRLPCAVPVVLLDRPGNAAFDPVNVTSLGMAADAAGNFYIATGPIGSAECGFFASGALAVIPSTLNFLTCAPVAASPVITSVDVALAPDGRRAYMSLANLGRVVTFAIEPPALGGASPLTAAILPTSRSVRVGTTATVFATMINAGATPATDCGIDLASAFTGSFAFQTTDPATNAPVGSLNGRVAIAGGGLQTFVLALTPSAAIPPGELALSFTCANVGAAAIIVGVNTLSFSASDTPIPDVVGLAATLSNDGIVNVAGANGTGVFSVATVNVGAAGTITVSADTGSARLPLAISLCETVPATGACMGPPAASVTTQVAGGATPTFGIFLQGLGVVPFEPAGNRISVRFRDAGGALRGATGVAVRTQ